MNRNTKILLSGIITGAATTQLLNMIFFGQSLKIGGEIFVPVLILLIRQAVIKTAGIFSEITGSFRRRKRK